MYIVLYIFDVYWHIFVIICCCNYVRFTVWYAADTMSDTLFAVLLTLWQIHCCLSSRHYIRYTVCYAVDIILQALFPNLIQSGLDTWRFLLIMSHTLFATCLTFYTRYYHFGSWSSDYIMNVLYFCQYFIWCHWFLSSQSYQYWISLQQSTIIIQ